MPIIRNHKQSFHLTFAKIIESLSLEHAAIWVMLSTCNSSIQSDCLVHIAAKKYSQLMSDLIEAGFWEDA